MDLSNLFSIGSSDDSDNSFESQTPDIDESDPKRVEIPEDELVEIRRVNDDLMSGIYRVGQLILEIYDRWDAIINTIENLRNRRSDIADSIEAKYISEDSESNYILDFDTSGGKGELVRSDVYHKEPDDGVPVNTDEEENVDPKGEDDTRPEEAITNKS